MVRLFAVVVDVNVNHLFYLNDDDDYRNNYDDDCLIVMEKVMAVILNDVIFV